MPRYKHYSQLIFFDTLAVICMVFAILTGFLPGPGGIPLFIIGLSLLAINHTWAQKYIDLLKKYADRISDIIFIPKLRSFFDVLAIISISGGVALIIVHDSYWVLSAGIFWLALGLLFFFGNRNRWQRLKKRLK